MKPTLPPETEPVAEGFRFDAVHVDVRRQVLCIDGKAVDIEPKPLALLIALAEANGGLIGKQALLARLWPRQVVTDAVLNQCVLRARQALGEAGHRAIVTVHRQGYRLGLPVQRIGGETAVGPEAARDIGVTAHARPGATRHGMIAGAVIATVLLLAGAAAWHLLPKSSRVTSIAVMPIELRDGSELDARIASGFGDALLTRLAQQPDLRVPARTSVGVAAEHRGDVRRVGRELDVDHLLEAVLRPDGEGYVLHASLVRSSDGFQRWAQRFDIPRGGLAAAEPAIVRAIVGVLVGPAGGVAPAPIGTGSDIAYKAYLTANALRDQRTEAALRWSIESYAEALRGDPDFAAAHAGAGMAWMLLYEYSNLSLADARRAARPHIDRALALAPGLADAHAALGLLELDAGDAVAAEAALRRAVELARADPLALMWLGTALTYQGRIDEARRWHEQALAIDPLSAVAETYVGIDRALAADAGAAAHFERALALESRFVEAWWQHALHERFRGDVAAATRHLRQALAIDGSSEYTRALLADALLASGDPAAANEVLGAGSDGSLAAWLRSAIAVADARGDTARAQALLRISADRETQHPDDRLLAAFASARLGARDESLRRFEQHIVASGANEPFISLSQADLGMPDLLLYLQLMRDARGDAAARTAADAASEGLRRLSRNGVRVAALDASHEAIDAFIGPRTSSRAAP